MNQMEKVARKTVSHFAYRGVFGEIMFVSCWKDWSGREDLNLRSGSPVMRRLCALQGGSPWSRTRFKTALNSIEICSSQVIDIEPVAQCSSKAVESDGSWRLWQPQFCL